MDGEDLNLEDDDDDSIVGRNVERRDLQIDPNQFQFNPGNFHVNPDQNFQTTSSNQVFKLLHFLTFQKSFFEFSVCQMRST